MTTLILDCEVYTNYFLASFLDPESGKVVSVEMFNDDCDDKSRAKVNRIMSKYQTTGFNSNNFDLPLLVLFCCGRNNAQLKSLCDAIITSGKPAWMICKDRNIAIPKAWDHIDLIEVLPGRASLKIYGGRINSPTIQDLPIEPTAIIRADQTKGLREYCENDLKVTASLYAMMDDAIALREGMSAKYDLDLRSKSDAQIAETIIKSEFTKQTGVTPRKGNAPDSVRYFDPHIFSFESNPLRDMFARILDTDFQLGGNGSIKLPDWLTKTPAVINGVGYKMGIGGLHSCEKQQFITIKDDPSMRLVDMDVASYYPSIILQQKLEPASLRNGFLSVYQSLVSRRLKAKHEGDVPTAASLKICINGSFGKLGSKYSVLYSPQLLIQTTITGQLALLMLIEQLTLIGVEVKSANTDGVVCLFPHNMQGVVDDVVFDWMLNTGYELEDTDYITIASRDVNNYVAVKPDRSVKRKGVFAKTGLMKNPDMPIIPFAVSQYISAGVSIAATIMQCNDPFMFCKLRRVNGGAVWRDEVLGKAVRFYWSSEVPQNEAIRYKTNSNTVPLSAGARPMMIVPDEFPEDIDYRRYIEAANTLKGLCGC